jgi:hypothetical protein
MATSVKDRADVDVVEASDLSAAIDILPRIVRGRRLPRGIKGVKVDVGPASGKGQEPGVAYCKVTIEGDTTKDRDAIKAKFTKSEGWTCTNTGAKTATCTNP